MFGTIEKGSENSEGTPQVTILIRSKEGNTENFAKFFEILNENGKKLGNFPKESFEGNFYKEMKKELKSRDFETVDISGIFCIRNSIFFGKKDHCGTIFNPRACEYL